MSGEATTSLVNSSSVVKHSWKDSFTGSLTNFKPQVSVACGHVWSIITHHPSWIPGLSIFTGIASGCFYSAFTVAGLAFMLGGIIGRCGAACIPHTTTAETLKNKSISLISTGKDLVREASFPAIRGWVSVVQGPGNALLVAHDIHNNVAEEHLFSLPTPLTHEKVT